MSCAVLIDSDDFTRKSLRDILANEGFEVIETADGQKGIAEIRNRDDVGVIFLADKLSGLSGLDTADRNFPISSSWYAAS